VGGHDTALVGYGRATLRGRLPWTVTAGRVPERPGEIALGPRAAHDLDVGVGDRLRARAPAGPVPLTVVGLVVLPSGNQEPLGRNALVTGGQLARLGGATPFSGLLVRGTDPPTGRALQRELARTLEIDTPRPPETVTALDELGRPMRILLAVLLLAVLLLLGQHVRVLLRRRRGQLGIAHVLGVPRRHLVVATVSAALGPTLLGTVIGGVVGWAATRLLLNEVGPRIGLGFTRPAFGPPLWIAAGAVGAALVVAAGAAVRATARIDRDRPRD
jgi:ABC-type lipoprotein release transport system permease subunit